MNASIVKCYLHAKKGFVLIPTAKNPAGIGRSINRPQTLEASVGDAELGAGVRLLRQWCDYALVDKTPSIPEVTAAGARSWRQFASASKLVVVAFDNTICLTPTTRDVHGGYLHLVDQTTAIPLAATDAELGAAVRHALSQCQ